MGKPEIPAEVRNAAKRVTVQIFEGSYLSRSVQGVIEDIVSAAILAAKAEEREACADICDQWLAMFGERGAELKFTSPQEWGNSAVEDVAEAIRSRGEVNTAHKNSEG